MLLTPMIIMNKKGPRKSELIACMKAKVVNGLVTMMIVSNVQILGIF